MFISQLKLVIFQIILRNIPSMGNKDISFNDKHPAKQFDMVLYPFSEEKI